MLDVIWLKRDVRIHDHGPFGAVGTTDTNSQELRNDCDGDEQPSVRARSILVLYLFEPDQLQESTVHGSHIAVIQEGLRDLDQRLCAHDVTTTHSGYTTATTAADLADTATSTTNIAKCVNREEDPSSSSSSSSDQHQQSAWKKVTICYARAIETFHVIHQRYGIARILAHEETGHWASYQRDRIVRKWCRKTNIQFEEFPQTNGVKRGLRDRNNYLPYFHQFMAASQYRISNLAEISKRIIMPADLPGMLQTPLLLHQIQEIPEPHRVDRESRQKGGETEALAELQSFLNRRMIGYSNGISSPNTSWHSCSRLSVYLAWGHVSLRYVIHAVRRRQAELKALDSNQHGRKSTSHQQQLRSLGAFLSRCHWRSHFMQKLESEAHIELRDMCPAYQHLRRGPTDWNQMNYEAWAMGRTGFPFVDACMRCLHQHGWINFRMRAMIVTFATYNLWLDWKRIAPHLARLFLDFEPGIHYPQLQMQSGTTGINAMRVYSVTKQGKDQDPNGVFIRRYVQELKQVPDKYIQTPWLMPSHVQSQAQCILGVHYPFPLVDEQESARIAKAKLSEVRKQESTQVLAKQVYEKHGSRNPSREMARNRSRKRPGSDLKQPSIKAAFKMMNDATNAVNSNVNRGQKSSAQLEEASDVVKIRNPYKRNPPSPHPVNQITNHTVEQTEETAVSRFWTCTACTFLNNKPYGLLCEICRTERQS